jgi:hypothetical protein
MDTTGSISDWSLMAVGDVLYASHAGALWSVQSTGSPLLLDAVGKPLSPAHSGNQLLYERGGLLWIVDGVTGAKHQITSADGPMPAITFSASTASVAEGGTTTVTVQRVDGDEGAVSVRWSTQDGSAQAGTHFGTAGSATAISGTLTWADGDMTPREIVIGGAGADVALIDDAVFGPASRSFSIALQAPFVGTLGANPVVQVAVLDDDGPKLAFVQGDYSVAEGAAATLVVRRIGPVNQAASVRWSAQSGTAVAGQDFSSKALAGGLLSWAAGDASTRSIVIAGMQDKQSEGDETYTVTLSSATGAVLGSPATATVTIVDDEVAPQSRVSFSSSKYQVIEGAGDAMLTVRRESIGDGFTVPLTVTYTTVAGTALATSDFLARSGTLTWSAVDGADKVIAVPIVNNTVAEGPKAFKVRLTTTSPGAQIDEPEARVTILDDDEKFPPQGAIPDDWTVPAGADAGWHVSNEAGAYEGVMSLRSDEVLDGQAAQVETTRTFAAGNITFRVKISSEAGFDVLRFYVDGVEKGSWSGTAVAGWQLFSTPVTADTHTIRWSYEKDGSASIGADAAWIDAVTLP